MAILRYANEGLLHKGHLLRWWTVPLNFLRVLSRLEDQINLGEVRSSKPITSMDLDVILLRLSDNCLTHEQNNVRLMFHS